MKYLVIALVLAALLAGTAAVVDAGEPNPPRQHAGFCGDPQGCPRSTPRPPAPTNTAVRPSTRVPSTVTPPPPRTATPRPTRTPQPTATSLPGDCGP